MYTRRPTQPVHSLICLLSVMLLSAAAAAQPSADFEDLYRQANELAQAGRPAQALAVYKQAYQAHQVPIVLVAIGLMNLQLGHFQDALKACQNYLDTNKSSAAHDRASDCVAQARDKLQHATLTKSGPVVTPLKPSAAPASPKAGSPFPAIKITEPFTTVSVIAVRPRNWQTEALVVEQLGVDLSSSYPQPRHVPPRVPIYKKWWFWTVIGVAVAGAATGIGVGVSQSGQAPTDPIADIPTTNRRVITFSFR